MENKQNPFCKRARLGPIAPTSGKSLPAICAALTLLMAMAEPTRAQYLFSNAWTVANGTAHIATGDVNRSVAYSAPANQVYVVNKGISGSGTTPAIDVFDGTGGAFLGSVEG